MGALRRVAEAWHARGWQADVAVALVAVAAYAWLGHAIFEWRPTGIDETVTLWQARNLLAGRLSVPFPALPEAVLTRYTGFGAAGHIGQFSLGTTIALAPFAALGAPWLSGPVWGGVGLVVWARFVRAIEADAPTALAAVLMLALSPFWAIQSTSQMAHVPLTAALLGVGLALRRALAPGAPPSHALWLGVLVGVAALLRPVEALAAAVPAAIVVLWQVARGAAPRAIIGYGLLGVAGPLALLLGANQIQTGSPFRFGYDAVWGAQHTLGFHETPLGRTHTPAAGLRNVGRQFIALGQAAWESTLTPWIPAVVAIVLGASAIGLLEGWLLATVGGIAIGYLFYWAAAEWLGPRFVLPVLPFVLLWAARLPRLVGRWGARPRQAAALVLLLAVVEGAVRGVPPVWERFDRFERTMTLDLAPTLATAPLPGVILVRDDYTRHLEARLRQVVGDAASARVLMRDAEPCEGLWTVRWLERAGRAVPVPPVPPAWRAWCEADVQRAAWRTGGDATGAILLYTTPERAVFRDLGARTITLTDSATLQDRTRLLAWQRTGTRSWVPRLLVFDADSARAAWVREDSAFAKARREVAAP